MGIGIFHSLKQKSENDDSFYTFNLHTKNDSLGEVWLRVVVEKRNNLSMQMWATNKKTYAKALSGSDKLNVLLNDAGLKVSSFEIFNEERPGNRIQEASKPIWVKKFFRNYSGCRGVMNNIEKEAVALEYGKNITPVISAKETNLQRSLFRKQKNREYT